MISQMLPQKQSLSGFRDRANNLQEKYKSNLNSPQDDQQTIEIHRIGSKSVHPQRSRAEENQLYLQVQSIPNLRQIKSLSQDPTNLTIRGRGQINEKYKAKNDDTKIIQFSPPLNSTNKLSPFKVIKKNPIPLQQIKDKLKLYDILESRELVKTNQVSQPIKQNKEDLLINQQTIFAIKNYQPQDLQNNICTQSQQKQMGLTKVSVSSSSCFTEQSRILLESFQSEDKKQKDSNFNDSKVHDIMKLLNQQIGKNDQFLASAEFGTECKKEKQQPLFTETPKSTIQKYKFSFSELNANNESEYEQDRRENSLQKLSDNINKFIIHLTSKEDTRNKLENQKSLPSSHFKDVSMIKKIKNISPSQSEDNSFNIELVQSAASPRNNRLSKHKEMLESQKLQNAQNSSPQSSLKPPLQQRQLLTKKDQKINDNKHIIRKELPLQKIIQVQDINQVLNQQDLITGQQISIVSQGDNLYSKQHKKEIVKTEINLENEQTIQCSIQSSIEKSVKHAVKHNILIDKQVRDQQEQQTELPKFENNPHKLQDKAQIVNKSQLTMISQKFHVLPEIFVNSKYKPITSSNQIFKSQKKVSEGHDSSEKENNFLEQTSGNNQLNNTTNENDCKLEKTGTQQQQQPIKDKNLGYFQYQLSCYYPKLSSQCLDFNRCLSQHENIFSQFGSLLQATNFQSQSNLSRIKSQVHRSRSSLPNIRRRQRSGQIKSQERLKRLENQFQQQFLTNFSSIQQLTSAERLNKSQKQGYKEYFSTIDQAARPNVVSNRLDSDSRDDIFEEEIYKKINQFSPQGDKKFFQSKSQLIAPPQDDGLYYALQDERLGLPQGGFDLIVKKEIYESDISNIQTRINNNPVRNDEKSNKDSQKFFVDESSYQDTNKYQSRKKKNQTQFLKYPLKDQQVGSKQKKPLRDTQFQTATSQQNDSSQYSQKNSPYITPKIKQDNSDTSTFTLKHSSQKDKKNFVEKNKAQRQPKNIDAYVEFKRALNKNLDSLTIPNSSNIQSGPPSTKRMNDEHSDDQIQLYQKTLEQVQVKLLDMQKCFMKKK